MPSVWDESSVLTRTMLLDRTRTGARVGLIFSGFWEITDKIIIDSQEIIRAFRNAVSGQQMFTSKVYRDFAGGPMLSGRNILSFNILLLWISRFVRNGHFEITILKKRDQIFLTTMFSSRYFQKKKHVCLLGCGGWSNMPAGSPHLFHQAEGQLGGNLGGETWGT